MPVAATSTPVEPLPPLDKLLPEHIAYVRALIARFSVTPTHYREDLVQDALVQVHRSRGSHLDVRALLFGITRHVVLKWIAKRDVERKIAALLASPTAAVASVEDDWQAAQRREAVHTVIDELPEPYRTVFVHVEIDGLDMSRTARGLGIPLNTGYTRLHVARKRFLAALLRILARKGISKEDL